MVLPWIEKYRLGLTLALSLEDWPSADRLIEWPGDDLRLDEGLDDLTPGDNAYQIWLAGRLRGDLNAMDEGKLLVRMNRRSHLKVLVIAAQALLRDDDAAFHQALSTGLIRHRGRTFKTSDIYSAVCIDGTVLWHLARRRSMRPIVLPPELEIFIARCIRRSVVEKPIADG
ncbi:hypothetical protein [Aquisphaera insulae]|uniref:hypothetical protein n=1 Tax=Aquisphaera insulae TaxID=2712864 RepID=UPI0013EB3106|nr:hypothetical protein [Aquisphaera insulae]